MRNRPWLSLMIARPEARMLAAFLAAGAGFIPHPTRGEEAKALSPTQDPQATFVLAGTIVQSGWRTDFTWGNPTQFSASVLLSFDPSIPPCNQFGCLYGSY